MEWAQFALEAGKALAWPIVVVVIAIMYRRHIRGLLDTGLKRIKAGPFEAEWDRAAAETRAALEDQAPFALTASRTKAIDAEPATVVEDSITQNRNAIVELLAQQTGDPNLKSWLLIADEHRSGLADTPENRIALILVTVDILRVIFEGQGGPEDAQAQRAFEGLLQLRNLAVHLNRPLTRGELAEFMLLTRIILSRLPGKPPLPAAG
ncbi:hypothetical protein [Micromonospora sp. NPDC051296]|uniref:hypothetical protein n=1 Tax=Micromonospora sp. NPDC051296 TaxID=3155046 RepID=UPI003440BC2B